ncbi:N-acetylmuramoyl-L-alanine amidase [Bacillus thuringiensis]|nr:N-acetylmuramoyl-L-alanine amidase [Bacillus thuringiensis]
MIKVFIDPGHGGKDSGTSSDDLVEKIGHLRFRI